MSFLMDLQVSLFICDEVKASQIIMIQKIWFGSKDSPIKITFLPYVESDLMFSGHGIILDIHKATVS